MNQHMPLHAGPTQAFPAPPDLFAGRDLRRSLFVDRLGRDRGPRRRRPLAGGYNRLIALGILAGARALSPKKT
ncbi:MAG: hypothetical protein EXQ83_03025 [Xanthobacteraceae bacterium]|nr:hypothetical protein [Xanthobacteraceae bacterium]